MSIIDHIFLFSLLFVVYVFLGKNNANMSGINFWVAAIVPIFLYVFVVGSRYGWGPDYHWYVEQFENVELIDGQVAFKWLNQFLNYIEFNYVGAFMVYAFLFIVCIFVLLRFYGKSSMYMYCFLVPATLYISTSTIRQGVGMSFIVLALVFFYKRKWLFMSLAALIAFNIHSATIVTLASIIGISLVIKKPISVWISIPIYLFLAHVFDMGKMTIIANLVENLQVGDRFQGYIDKSEYWFGEEAMEDFYQYSRFSLTLISLSLFHISLFYYGYKALKVKENKQVLYMYNTVVLGILFLKAVAHFEILRRFAQPMEMFYFIPLGYIFYVYYQDSKYSSRPDAIRYRKYFPYIIMLILQYLFVHWGRLIFLNKDADFFWYHISN